MRRVAVIFALTLAALGSLGACSSHEGPDEPASELEPDLPAPSSEPATVAPPLPREARVRPTPDRLPAVAGPNSRPLLGEPAEGAPVYFAFARGLVRFDEGGWTTVWTEPFRFALLGADRRVYLEDEGGIHRVDADSLTTMLAYDLGSDDPKAAAAAIGPRGDIWILEQVAAEGFDGQESWSLTRIDLFGRGTSWTEPGKTGFEYVLGLAVDGNDEAWLPLASRDGNWGILHERGDRRWRRVQPWAIDADPYVIKAFHGDPEGGLLLLTDEELLRVGQEGPRDRAVVPGGKVQRLAVNGAGRLAAVSAGGCRLHLFQVADLAAGPSKSVSPPTCADGRVLLALDDRGRAWEVEASERAHVLAEDGTRQELSLEVFELSELRALLIPGAGPVRLEGARP